MIRVVAKVDAVKATEEFNQARRDIQGKLKEALLIAGETEALPEAKRRAAKYKVAGEDVASTLVVRSRPTSAYLTSTLRGKKGRAVGLLEFGGTVRTAILPKHKKGAHGRPAAVMTPQGPRAAVRRPRHYFGRHFLTGAVEARQAQIQQSILREVMHAFDGLEHIP